MREFKYFNNRRRSRELTWLKLWLEDRLLVLTLSGEVKTGDSRWTAYQTLIELAETMSYRYYERYLENV